MVIHGQCTCIFLFVRYLSEGLKDLTQGFLPSVNGGFGLLVFCF